MSTSLQQLAPVTVELESKLGRSIAIHRRLGSLLFYSSTENGGGVFQVFRREGIKVEGSWINQGSWEIRYKSVLVSSAAIETMGAFLVVLSTNEETSVLFLDSLNCSLISLSELSSVVQPLCADIDQNRKELLVGFTRGVLLSFAIRLNINSSFIDDAHKGSISENQKMIHLVCRKQIMIRKTLGLTSLEPFTPYQIAVSDVIGATYVLSYEGSVCCLETSTFKCLWLLKRSLFKYTPVYIWVDHFGSDFILLYSSYDHSKEKKESCLINVKDKTNDNDKNDNKNYENNGIQILEYWTPPNNYDDINKGLFNRIEIPLSGKLNSLSIETINTDFNTVIVIASNNVSNNNQIQLYRKNNKNNENAKNINIILDSSLVYTNDFGTDTHNHQIFQNRHIDAFSSKNERKFQNVSTFIDGSISLPDCPVLFLSVTKNEICTVALHIPTLYQKSDHQKSLLIAASKIEISFQPKKIKNEANNEYDEFLKKFQNKSLNSQATSRIKSNNLNGTGPKAGILISPSKILNKNSKMNLNKNFDENFQFNLSSTKSAKKTNLSEKTIPYIDIKNKLRGKKDSNMNILLSNSPSIGNILEIAINNADNNLKSISSSNCLLNQLFLDSNYISDSSLSSYHHLNDSKNLN